MKLTVLLLFTVSVNGGAVCAAATLHYHGTGVFDEFQPDTPYGAPNQPFDFRFTLPSTPTPDTIGPNYFGVPTTATLAVESRPVLVSDVEVAFYQAGGFSGLEIRFADYRLGFGALGLFTGPLTSPTLQVGNFQLAGGTLTVTSVPEPATTIPGLVGFVILIARRAASARVRSRPTWKHGLSTASIPEPNNARSA